MTTPLIDDIRAAWRDHGPEAERAYRLFLDYYPDAPRVPGCATVLRLAYRLSLGITIEQAAAREYLYRWRLVLGNSPIFGVPHTIGM